MKGVWLSLAAVDLSELRAIERNAPAKTGLGLLLGAVGAVIAAVLIWAVFFRKREDETARRYREHFLNSQETHPDSIAETAGNGQQSSSRRKRKRRREHRQRNPTLAETGGLPPLRDQVPSDDPP